MGREPAFGKQQSGRTLAPFSPSASLLGGSRAQGQEERGLKLAADSGDEQASWLGSPSTCGCKTAVAPRSALLLSGLQRPQRAGAPRRGLLFTGHRAAVPCHPVRETLA